ncbi:ATPase, partial [Mesorhizobium sp. M7A.F.Ca.ET.027.03.2.1]
MTYEASDPQALPAELKVERAETGRRRRLLHQARSAGGLLLAVGLVWLILFITTDGVFISDRNLINLMRQTSVTAMVALGMLVIIAQGEIDLSVGSFLSLCATVIALMESWAGLPAPVTILAALVLGAIVGLWNGLW